MYIAGGRGLSTVMLIAAREAAMHLGSFASATLSKAWPSYALILLLQFKVIWLIWELRDITSGDTASYFERGLLWARGFHVNILWSPLYTAFYGSFLFATQDPYNATILHRIAIVLLAALGVLFVLRQLLPPGWALLGAAWWAILPINYNTLYEVHLFALLPVLLAWALVLGWDAPWARGAAVAILATCVVCVRNEFSVAAVTLALLCLIYEWRRSDKATRLVFSYLAPLLAGLAVCILAYWRSIVKFPQIWPELGIKHTLNMCQVFAFGYQQRHPEWTASPWTECQPLARSTFGVDYPSLGEMLWSNPTATLTHFLWNLKLVPSGLEVLLFNAHAGKINPDYVPTEVANYPMLLAALVAIICLVGARLAWRERPCTIWSVICSRVTLAFVPLLIMAVPVVLVQRPRPSYFFYVSVIVIAATMGALVRIFGLRTRGEDRLGFLAIAIIVLLTLVAPGYSLPSYLPSGRPLMTKLEHLTPQRSRLVNPDGGVVLGDWSAELVSYLNLSLPKGYPREGPRIVFDNGLLQQWNGEIPLEEFLAKRQVSFLYLDPHVLARLRAQPQAKNLLENPRAVGWVDIAHENRGEQSWALLGKM